jgi:CTP:molybdopterin cytidylyltransferase MocA
MIVDGECDTLPEQAFYMVGGSTKRSRRPRRIPDDHTVLVLYGDVPLIRTDTLRNCSRSSREKHGAAEREIRQPGPATAASSAMRAAR